MSCRSLLISCGLLALAGCGVDLKKDLVASPDPQLLRDNGVVLIADVCVYQEGLSQSDDYFAIAESRNDADALLTAAASRLRDAGVPVHATLVPFVCGALHDKANPPVKAAENIGGPVTSVPQPFGIQGSIKADQAYLSALSQLATLGFYYATTGRLGPGNGVDNTSSWEKFEKSAHVIADRTGATSVLYLGVLGYSETSGRAAALGIGRFMFGMATGVLTGGHVIIIPGQNTDGRLVSATLVDLPSGEAVWSNAIRGAGDPMKPEIVADAEALDRLLSDLLQRTTAEDRSFRDNVLDLEKERGSPAKGAIVTAPEKIDLSCRALAISIPHGATFTEFVRQGFIRILRAANLYDGHNGLPLSVHIDSIDSSSMGGGWWEIDLTVGVTGKPPISVKSRYDFSSSFRGDVACARMQQSLEPAVEAAFRKIIQTPGFGDLLRPATQSAPISMLQPGLLSDANQSEPAQGGSRPFAKALRGFG
jgi:hypothetical protein